MLECRKAVCSALDCTARHGSAFSSIKVCSGEVKVCSTSYSVLASAVCKGCWTLAALAGLFPSRRPDGLHGLGCGFLELWGFGKLRFLEAHILSSTHYVSRSTNMFKPNFRTPHPGNQSRSNWTSGGLFGRWAAGQWRHLTRCASQAD